MAAVDGLTPLIRVLIVDDDALVRSGLAMILGGAVDLAVVGQADDGRHALAAVREHRPDVVLMDIRMPRMSGLEATEQLMSWPRPPRVIVLTTFDEDVNVTRALRAGATGFLLKDTPPAQIVDAIRRVSRGEPMLSPGVTARLITQVTGGGHPDRVRLARQRMARLTEREHDVAVQVGAGLNNTEIADALHLSVPTVKAHVGRLFTKLEATNRVQIALCVREAGQG